GDEVWAIAYLREGTAGVAQVLVSGCVAQDWLLKGSDGTFITSAAGNARAQDPLIESFLQSLRGKTSAAFEVKEAAHTAALAAEDGIKAELEQRGFLRSAQTKSLLAALTVGGGVFAVIIGAIRIHVRSVLTNGEAAPPIVLSLAMVAVVVVTFIMA